MMESQPRILLPAPRVIIIDNEEKHLEPLAQALSSYGVSCRSILFEGMVDHIPQFPHVRVIFSDLNLLDIPTSDASFFSAIGGLLEHIKPMGPYCIILWTEHSKKASNLKTYLQTKNCEGEKNLKGIQPFDVKVIDKSILKSEDLNKSLIDKIKKTVADISQYDALFIWESRVLEAATKTMASLLEMSDTPEKNSNKELGKLLETLGHAAASEKAFKEDPLRAVNEALLPILADHIASIRLQDNDQQVWEKAIKDADSSPCLPDETLARLNKLFHIESEEVSKWSERGAVIPLPKKFENEFEQTFGLTEEDTAKQFGCKDFAKNRKETRWVLVQSQAACDYALEKKGLLPFYLGLLVQEAKAKKDKPPDALWTSPIFEWENQKVFLHVHAGFPFPFPKTTQIETEPIFRLREQILNSMIYELHSHSARPGIISPRKKKFKQPRPGSD